MQRVTKSIVVVLCLSLIAAVIGDALRRGEDALIQRRYQDAVVELRQAVGEAQPQEKERVLLLLARAQQLAGDGPAAVATYRRLLEEHPASHLRAKARFQLADALSSSGNQRDAAAIYRDEVERLISDQRKEEVAETYLGLAEKASHGEKPEWGRAVTFYDLALDLGLSAQKARATRLAAAEARLLEGNVGNAIERLQPLVAELDVPSGKLKALLLLGRAKASAGDRAGARAVFADLIVMAKASDEASEAAYQTALAFGVPQPNAAEVDRAVAALTAFASAYPAHSKAKVARYLVAQCLQHAGRSDAALVEYRRFVAEHADDDLPELASARATIGDVLAAQGKLSEALVAWQDYLGAHPAHQDWERVQRAIVDTEWGMAMAAFLRAADDQKFDDARARLDEFMRAYPLDERNPEALRLFGEMLAREKKLTDAVTAFERCVRKYPGKEASAHAQFRVGEIFEGELFNYLEALTAYRKVTWGSHAARAQERIARLERKHLELATTRTYRTGETATFKAVTRNIEKLRVRVFRLDMETYFRATHGAGNVEGLDIEVIEADKTFESVTPDYKQHRQSEREVDIGFKEAGAYVVKVDEGELEATTMLLVTDVALIAKTSRHELFVFTQNLKENRVEGGVKVVVSDGTKVVTEGVTGKDGVYRFRGEALKDTAQLRVFAVSAGGSGAGLLALNGLGYSTGLQPVGYLFTDRPAYQPGQVAHVKGIVREVKDGLYALPADSYRVQAFSAGGRLVLQRDIAFTPFGSFAIDVPLPPEAELGEWRVAIDRGAGDAFAATFTVARYERPKLQMVGEPAAAVVYRGELLKGRFVVSHFFGEPARGKVVRYALQMPGGVTVEREGTTNALGEVEFAFDTKDFAEEAMAVITASVAEENVQAVCAVPIATTEFVPTLTTMRGVYLAGETFQAAIELLDRAGKPLGKQGTAVLLRRERKGGTVAEVELLRQAFTTEAKSGRAEVQFVAQKGGDHVVRVEAQDRFGVLVTGQLGLVISGEEDAVKLRLLSDRETYKVGETVTVKVMNRAGARLALETVQGDGILAYRALSLPAGESTLTLKLGAMHAPNFALALAVIADQKLLGAEREFKVERDLQVTLSVPAAAKPGSSVSVQVEVRDAEGQPVVGEVALAVVDEALLAIHADQTPAMAQVFFGKRRETAFRTVSSCEWSYRGQAQAVSAELAAEERRVLRELDRSAALPMLADLEVLDGVESAFQSTTWNTAVGLGGSAGEKFGGRQGGRAKLGRKDAAGQITGSDDFYVGGQLFDKKRLTFDLGAGGWDDNLLYQGGGVAPDRPRTDFSETGAWLSAIVTGSDGKAKVDVPLPDSTTAWRLVARAVTVATDVGEARGAVKTSKELQASVLAPLSLTQGDKIELRVRVHNLGDTARDARVTLATGADQPGDTQAVPLPAHAEAEVAVSFDAAVAAAFDLRALVEAGELRDEMVQPLVVLPYGREVRTGKSGSTSEATRFKLALPTGDDYVQRALTLAIGPDLGRDLVAAALGLGYEPLSCRRVDLTNLALASRGLSALLVLDWLEKSGGATPNDIARLRGQASANLARLLALQRKDGAYGWVKQAEADVRTTSQALLFASHARKRGLVGAGELADKASEWLLAQLRTTRERPRTLLALAAAGRARFEDLNALHRERAALSLDALARLALAWHLAGRQTLAQELGDALRGKLSPLPGANDAATVESIALGAVALLAIDAKDRVAAASLTWLDAQRVGVTFGSAEATVAALWASTASGGRAASAASEGEISVLVNGRELAKVPATARTDRSTFNVPAEWLAASNEVEIKVAGRALVHYQVTLTGFAKGFPEVARSSELVRIERQYLAPFRRFDGKIVSPGFGVVNGTYQSFENKVSRTELGQAIRVRTRFWVPHESNRALISPLVVEEPIPAGCSVSRESIRGSFDHVEVEPDRLTFYYREGNTGDSVTYDLEARFVGDFGVLPTQVYGALRPDLMALGQPQQLTVDRRGEGKAQAYRETPDELYHIGKALFDQGELPAAGLRLRALLDEWQKEKVQLRDDVRKDVARMLLFVAIASKDATNTVRFFEELKDRYADLVIPFDKIVAVGQAYVDLGEFERALMVFRAAAESSFLKDAAVATTLEGLGEVNASVRFLQRLLGAYPDLNLIRTGLYSVAQRQADLAAKLQPGAVIDPRVGSARDLRAAALSALREFLVLYPDDPLAEEVAFAWATTFLEAKDLAAALAVAEQALACYPGSVLTDEFLYTAGYAQFALGKPEAAFAILKRVAEETFPQPSGARGPSENRDHAVYLQGQIHHALGQPELALAAYDKVKDKFSDAVEATDYFVRKRLSLPEVTTVSLADPVKMEVQFRNIDKVAVTVYRVDLMRLYLLEKSLNDIRGVQLHGIRPYAELTLELGDGRDYKQQTKSLPLDLKDPGAYLVVLRGGDLLATGMLLRSDLRIEVQEALDVGRIRVNVKANDGVVSDAHVKVIGAGDQRFRSGESDLRGVFIAEDLVGQATVIVKKGDSYAFHRGTGVHQPARVQPAQQVQVQLEGKPGDSKDKAYKKFDALDNNIRFNEVNRAQQVQWLQNEVMNKQQKGVEVYRTK